MGCEGFVAEVLFDRGVDVAEVDILFAEYSWRKELLFSVKNCINNDVYYTLI